MITRYGWEWPEEASDLTIELAAFKMGLGPECRGLGKAEHFWRVVDTLFNWEGSPAPFNRTPWAEEMIEEACENKFLGVAGCASSGKSGTFAMWGLVEFLADPANTKVLITSTSLKAGRKRIWGSVVKWWRVLGSGFPGKLVDSLGAIRFVDEQGHAYDTAGLELIACEQKKEKEAIDKLIGFKNKRVIFIADELPDLSEAILTAALSNLSVNPYFQLIGLGNPNSYFDAFGVFCEPKDGYKNLSRGAHRWETRYGICIQFDAHDSPNVVAGKNIYDWGMPTVEWVNDQKNRLGENSRAYWRMVRGFWSPTGAEDAVFSENDILLSGGYDNIIWQQAPVRIAGLDPSFTDGGDRVIGMIGEIGQASNGILTLKFCEWIEFHDDMSRTDPRTFQMAEQFRDWCISKGIPPYNAAIDSTGGGAPFWDVLAKLWSDKILRVGFGGSPTERRVSETDRASARTRYSNRATQLWYSMVDLLRAGQLKGISKEMSQELTARRYTTRKAPPDDQDKLGLQYIIEPKKEMKARIGHSPDLADAGAVLTELAIDRFGLSPGVSDINRMSGSNQAWDDFVKSQDVAAKSDDYLYWAN